MAAWWAKDNLRPLRRALGKDKVLTSPEAKAVYGKDATELTGYPQAVVLAESVEDIQITVRFALDNRMTITPRGAGSGLSGGSIPHSQGIVLSCENMREIIDFNIEDSRITVQPGVTTQFVQQTVQEAGLFYPPDPASYTVSTIGGNVAENAGGLRCFKYGVTSHYVLGLEYVDSTGEIKRTGSLEDSVFNPDHTPLLIGSEGTMGIFSQIELRLVSQPEKTVTIAAYFEDSTGGFEMTEKIIQFGLTPSILEYIDKTAMMSATQHTGFTLNAEAESMLLIELDGDVEKVGADLVQVEKLLKADTSQLEIADNPVHRERLWSLRRAISPSLIRMSTGRIHEDIAVPRSKLVEISSIIDKISKTNEIKIAKYGHAGDGNLHIVFLFDKSDSVQVSNADKSVKELFANVILLSGTISGEHGIGLSKREYLQDQLSEVNISIARQIRDYFDPTNLLNPHKIFYEI